MEQHSSDSLNSQDPTERRAIPGYEGIYEIDILGNVYAMQKHKGLKAGRMNQPTRHKSGYMYINLSKNKKAKKHYIHCLVMDAFNPTEDKTLEVNHIDGVKSNCALSNLEWLSHAQNMIHARTIDGTWKDHRGESMGSAKLTEDDVKHIRRLWENGMQQKEIAPMFGVSPVRISLIVNRKSWKHVE
jgi:hypothetical protein